MRTWEVTPDGILTSDLGLLRTQGKPYTVGMIAREYGELISDESKLELMLALIATESRGDPLARRYERHLGEYSIGLCQMLVSTAEWLETVDKRAPRCPASRLWDTWLTEPLVSIEYALAYLRRFKQYTDPIYLYAAYNAGNIYKTDKNLWGLRSYGNALDQFARWYGDACYVVQHSENFFI